MARYFVTVKTPDGINLINRMMTECETVKDAVRTGKRAVIDGNLMRFNTPSDIAPFMRSVEVRCETVADVALSPRQKPQCAIKGCEAQPVTRCACCNREVCADDLVGAKFDGGPGICLDCVFRCLRGPSCKVVQS